MERWKGYLLIKMSDILNDLFYGRLAPYENCIPDTAEYQQTEQQENHLAKQFLESLTAEQKGLYQELEKISNRLVSMELEQSFSQGFRLGCRIIFLSLQK